MLLVAAEAVAVAVLVLVAHAFGSNWATVIAGFAAQIAVLSFVTLRAYPPGMKRPMILFAVVTVFLSALVPLIYLNWLWVTKKKWREVEATDESYAVDSAHAITQEPQAPLVASPIDATGDYKICPDCAEEVRAAARVCRFCGYRFNWIE